MFEKQISWIFDPGTPLTTPFVSRSVRTVGDVAPEITTDDDVPGWVKLFITLALDVGCNILLNCMLFKGVGHNGDDLCLRLFAHVHISYDRLGRPSGLGRRYISWGGHRSRSAAL